MASRGQFYLPMAMEYRVELAIQSWLGYTMYPFMANYLKVFSHPLVASSPTVGWVPLNQHHWLETPIVDRWKWLEMLEMVGNEGLVKITISYPPNHPNRHIF